MPKEHDFDCECEQFMEEVEEGLNSMFPNAESEEDLEEELEHELSRMLDR